MNAQQLTDALDQLSLDPKALSKMLGVDQRSVYRWLSGEHHIPLMVVSILCLLRAKRFTVDSFVAARAAFVASKPSKK